MIKDRLGQAVFGTNTYFLDRKIERLSKGQAIVYTFEFIAALGEGTYSISVALHTEHTHLSRNYEWRDLALVFNVINVDKSRFVGVAWIPPSLECIE